jgi:hypothetical protein
MWTRSSLSTSMPRWWTHVHSWVTELLYFMCTFLSCTNTLYKTGIVTNSDALLDVGFLLKTCKSWRATRVAIWRTDSSALICPLWVNFWVPKNEHDSEWAHLNEQLPKHTRNFTPGTIGLEAKVFHEYLCQSLVDRLELYNSTPD